MDTISGKPVAEEERDRIEKLAEDFDKQTSSESARQILSEAFPYGNGSSYTAYHDKDCTCNFCTCG